MSEGSVEDRSLQQSIRRAAAVAVSIVSPLVLFAVLEPLVRSAGRLPLEAYERSFFLSALPARLVHLATQPVPAILSVSLLAIGLSALVVLPAGRRFLGALCERWEVLEEGAAVRWLVGALTGIAAWTYSTYAYNGYFDQPHLLDRLILVCLWLLLLWRPVFALPFALVLVAVLQQLVVPLQAFSWTEVELLVRIPVLFGAFWIVRSLTRSKDSTPFLFVFCCMLAATYWVSGWGKIQIGWLGHPHIDFLPVGAWASGWLAFLEPATVAHVSQSMEPFNIPLMLFTLIVECGALLILLRRWTLLAIPALCITFHVGVFAFTGIFFWKWLLVEAALLLFLLTGRRLQRLGLFGPGHFGLSVLLILSSPWWMSPMNLTWLDTPLTYGTRLDAVGSSGAEYSLHPGHFKPYAEVLTLGPFHYLSPHPQLTGAMGVTSDADLADALRTAPDLSAIADLEIEGGFGRWDAGQAARFDEFVARQVRTLNRNLRHPFGGLAPRHLWSFARANPWEGQEPIASVRVLEVTVFYDGQEVREIRTRLLREIDVRTGRGTAAPAAP